MNCSPKLLHLCTKNGINRVEDSGKDNISTDQEEDNIYAESRVTLRPVALLAFGAGFVIRLVKRRQEREQTNDSSAQAAGADPNETEVQ